MRKRFFASVQDVRRPESLGLPAGKAGRTQAIRKKYFCNFIDDKYIMVSSLILPLLFFIIIILLVVFIRVHFILQKSEKLREQLKEERDLAKAIVASMGEGLLVLDTNYKVKLINPAAEKLLETTAREAVGQKWAEFGRAYIADKPIPFEKRSAVISLNKGEIKVTGIADDHYYVTRSGRRFPVVAITAPLIHDDKAIGIVKVFHDASHEKDVDRMKTEFISLASHQLRTPLSAIKWFVELLSDKNSGPLTEEQRKYIKNLAFSTERMIELVNSLLNISRIESGRIMIEPKPTDLSKLVGEVVIQLKKKIDSKKIKLIISTHQNLPKINLDPKLISHVYMNLIDNAIKYTPVAGEVSVFISKKEQEIVSQISDSGFGIPRNEQERIFQKFFRATNAVKKVTEGSGLGLYLVKSIVESSKGRIWFKSDGKKGATFWFTLPISGMRAKQGEVSLD